MNNQQAKKLLEKYNNGTASQEERQQVETYFYRYLQKKDQLPGDERLSSDQAEIKSKLLAHISANETPKFASVRKWPRIAAAASIILALSAGGYFQLHKRPVQQTAENQQGNISPGRNQATLTLANGQKIILTKGLNGKLAQQGNTAINVNAGNAIAYQVSGQSTLVPAVQYNTLSTAKGEQSPYPLILPDGSKAWLNAASSITFPTAFAGKERLVKITGEVYFEVVHNAAQPFKVAAAGQMVQDVGTHFNINAYSDEPAVTTTITEGAVAVSLPGTHETMDLKAGQQSLVKAGAIVKIADADISIAMGWREGHFKFKDAGIQEVMRQFSRWYNVDVVYEGQIPKFSFTGALHRDINASQALDVLKTFNVNYKIDGNKIIITK